MKRLLLLALLLLAAPAHAVIYTIAAGDTAGLRTTIQTTASNGDVIEVPAGTYTIATAITISKNLTILGGEGEGTIIAVTGSVNGFAIDPNAAAGGVIDGLRISGIHFLGNGVSSLAGIKTIVTAAKKIRNLSIERCSATRFTNGFDIGGATMTTDHLLLSQSRATSNLKAGIKVTSCSPNTAILQCWSRANNTANDTGAETGCQFLIKACSGFSVVGCYADSLPTTAGATKIGLCVSGCNGGFITGLNAKDTALQVDGYGLRLVSSSVGVTVGSMEYTFIQYPISADATSIYPTILPRNVVKEG